MRRLLLILAGVITIGLLATLIVGLNLNRVTPTAQLAVSLTAPPTLVRVNVTAPPVTPTATHTTTALVLSAPSTNEAGPSQTPLPTSTPGVTLTAPVQAQTHTVLRGETLYRIAQHYGVSVDDLRAANDWVNPEDLRSGTALIIPLPVTPAPAITDTLTPVRTALPTLTPSGIPTIDGPVNQTHTVLRGETLFRIAQRYGVTVDDLRAANDWVTPEDLRSGTTLIIPLPNTEPPPAESAAAMTATPIPTPPPWPTALNGIALDDLLILPPETWEQVYAIAQRGQGLGRNGSAFSKLGDSTIENPHFLARYDGGEYYLGDYAFVQPAVDHFQGSFARQSIAVQRGLNSYVVFDAMWARNEACPPDVGPLACEITLHNPAVIFIRLGTNDRDPVSFEANLRRIVQLCMDQGVIPLLGTKADLRTGTTGNNDIIRRVAAEMHVPLWDFGRVAATLPGRGLTNDGIHLATFYAHDYRDSAALQRGYGVHNLLALMMLERIRPMLEAVNPAG